MPGGSNAIIAIVVGAIVVIVGFSLWPVLNAASNNLYSYFRDSCDDGAGNRFLRLYKGVTTDPKVQEYNAVDGVHGGKGVTVSGNATGKCIGTFPEALAITDQLYNEQGEQVAGAALGAVLQVLDDPYEYIAVADILKRFSGINNLLLTILPVISIAGFLGISGVKLYAYGKGSVNISSVMLPTILTLIAIVVGMVIAGPIMGSLVDANQVVESGQYQINGVFGNIISLLFAILPIFYVAGLVTLVGLQAKPGQGGFLP